MVDSQPGGSSPTCLDAATLAAFVDGKLDEASRSRVVTHIAECPDCYELVAEVVSTEEELQQSPAKDADSRSGTTEIAPLHNVVSFRRRGWAMAAGAVALAASVMLIVSNRGTQLDPLVAIVGSERLTLARPSGGFQYGPLRSPMRGTGDTENLQLLAEAARLRERAARTQSADDLHASGIAQLLAGDADASITALESASQSKPRDAAFRADVGTAYMTRFVNRGDQADAAAALDSFDKALALSPAVKEAWFNKAILLQQLDRPAEAVAAWNTYLELPAETGWREEAIRNRDAALRQSSGR